MITWVTASADATIYERNTNPDLTEQNTGLDEVLELSREEFIINDTNSNFVSRILIKFDNIPSYQGNGEYWLKLYETAGSNNLSLSFTVEVARLTADWEMGIGKKSNNPIVTKGVSWNWRDTKDSNAWISPGGDYSTTTTASVDFTYKSSDLAINVTDIVTQWSASSEEPNYGFIIKYANIDEKASGSSFLQFYSSDTHTIYYPRLEYKYDDSSFEPNDLMPLNLEEEILVYPYHLKGRYKKGSIIKFRTIGREMYPTKTYVTESVNSITTTYLPETSYYSIVDMHTEEAIIPFDNNYTKLSCDNKGNYFMLDTSHFETDRYYKIVYKVDDITTGTKQYFDGAFVFEVVK